MAERPTNSETTLQITRTFAASRQEVFDAWTHAEKLTRWLCRVSAQHSTKIVELDARAGGRYRLEVTTPEGEVYVLSGFYREVRPPDRLVFTWQWETDPKFGESLVTVELFGRGDLTEMVLTHERFPSKQSRDRHAVGWDGCFQQLDDALRS